MKNDNLASMFNMDDNQLFRSQVNSLSANEHETLLNDQNFIQALIAHPDRHAMSNYFYSLEKKQLSTEALQVFRTGAFVTLMYWEIRKRDEEQKPSEAFEWGDKFNYLSLIPDDLSKVACYTHDNVIDDLVADNERSHWFRSGTVDSLPALAKATIATKLLEKGEVEKATYCLNSIIANDPLTLQKNSNKQY